MIESRTIAKQPSLDPAEDYAFLRAKGLEYIQQLGSRIWTDYNIHDPGITLLESLGYALTDLGYRAGFGMPDLLGLDPKDAQAAKRQGFHTAREILTMSPLTVRDYRKLLIGIEGIKNGWLHIRSEDDPSVPIYADCQRQVLQYFPETDRPLRLRGLYDVSVEFEDIDGMGNLNSGKVFYALTFPGASGKATMAILEMRLPSWQALEEATSKYRDFRKSESALCKPEELGGLPPVLVKFISGNVSDNHDLQPADFASALRGVIFATLEVHFHPNAASPGSPKALTFNDVPLRIWFRSESDRKSLKIEHLKQAIADFSAGGLIGKYHALVRRADSVITSTRQALQAARNLCEDWCSIGAVPVEEIAVCADVDVDPAADIEAVMAEVHYRIDQYFSPDLRFHSLADLLKQGKPVETIFEGPKIDLGFLDNEQVDATQLRTHVYTSDIMHLLLEIKGIKAVRHFTMTRYDQAGRPKGNPESWELAITPRHQPRFYPQASKFLIFKNGLPFLPNAHELQDVLNVIRGRNTQPRFSDAEMDLPIPQGERHDLMSYMPVQYQLPLTYGVGYEGLPKHVGAERLAQARQLKAYLLVFEQMLANSLSQLAHVSELFAIDATVKQTYFTRFIDEMILRGAQEELYAGWNENLLQSLAESPEEWRDRRNRFLDHLLARFAESFSEYAIMLFRHAESKAAAKEELIESKIAFLKDLPRMTHDRAKAFDYRASSGGSDASIMPGLALRIQRLLGLNAPEDKVIVVEHLLLRPRRKDIDALLPICLAPGCEDCGDEDPYSFRLTVVLCGEGGKVNEDIEWRRFAEKAIRTEIPAHLAAKICWVSREQWAAFESAWLAYAAELARDPVDADAFTSALSALLKVFTALKSVYPPASLHDCADGNDENRIFLNRTVITSKPMEE